MMNRSYVKILSFLLITSGVIFNYVIGIAANTYGLNTQKTHYQPTIDDSFADDRVLVVFTQEASVSFNEILPEKFPEIECDSIRGLTTSKFNRGKFAIQSALNDIKNGRKPTIDDNLDLGDYRNIVCLLLNTPGKQNVLDAVESLNKRDDVLYAGPDYTIELNSTSTENSENSPYYIPIDTLKNILQLPDAWDEVTYEDTLKIAVIDSGIDDSMDNSGLRNYVMDESVDFSDYIEYNSDTNPNIPLSYYNSDDITGHGTHVAGILAFTADMYFQFHQQNYGRVLDLLSVKVLDERGTDVSNVLCAIDYIEGYNIHIINASLGGEIPYYENENYNPLKVAIDNFDGVFVCSAGNGRINSEGVNEGFCTDGAAVYPAAWEIDNMITVGSSTASDTVSSFSNYGSESVDLFAPGESIYSCFSTFPCDSVNCLSPNTHISYGYHSLKGTSMATPFVTGVVSLLYAIDPDFDEAIVKQIIIDTVDECDSMYGKCVSGGRLNAYNAVMMAKDYISCQHTNYNYIYSPKNASCHCIKCPDCLIELSTESHNYLYTDINSSIVHRSICSVCSYQTYTAHNWYISSRSSDECEVVCHDCSHSITCYEPLEYSGSDESGHTAACSEGCFSSFEAHSYTYDGLSSLYTHDASCAYCSYSYVEDHDWLLVGSTYRCLICKRTSAIIPGAGVTGLSEAGLKAALSTLSPAEIEELLSAASEEDRSCLIAALPPSDDHELLTE